MILIARLTWDEAPTFSAGVDRAVFYPTTGSGEAWNGLVSVNEKPSSEERLRHLDGLKIAQRRHRDDFSGLIQAYTYPDSFYENVILQVRPNSFGLTYRTLAGNNYRIHLVYNVVVLPTDHTYQQRDPDLFQWNFTTTPVDIPFGNPSAHLVIDGDLAYSWAITDLEEILYGNETQDPRLPTPQEVWDLIEENSLLIVVDHGDGTFTITGPDDAITMLSATTFEIDWPSVVLIDVDTYQISSL